jgi:hypothetical protein
VTRLLPWLAAAALLLPLAACSDETPSVTPDGCAGDVEVTDADGLHEALDAAEPGQTIALAAGTYDGPFTITRSGTADAAITLCGPRDAVLDGGSTDHGYVLHLDGASYWTVSGLGVTRGQKGVMLDGASYVELVSLYVDRIGDEGIHLRAGSSHNLVRDTIVQRTGLRKPEYGEGIYVGSAESNWCDISDCAPDRSDHNRVEGNTVRATTAEAVDVKEGTTGGRLVDNDLDGPTTEAADSVVDLKGNGWTVRRNVVRARAADGIQVHVVVSQWGRGNRIVENSFHLSVSGGHAVDVVGDAREAGNVVTCDQRVRPDDGELTNVECD